VQGDPAAHRELVALHTPFAHVVAARLYARRVGLEVGFDEYFQLAMVGLLEAVERFVPGGAARFRTFAMQRVQGAIRNGLERLTERQQQAATRRRLASERVASLVPERIDSASGDEVLGRLGDLAVGVAIGFILEAVGLAPEGRDARGADPYAQLELRQLRDQAWQMVERLPERERFVITMHYRNGRRFEEIARILKVTKGRVSQVHAHAVRQLRALVSKADRCNITY
jgi:RNA polymerase sigma factor for flagellar operon FliA